jgi:hypothetical protein
MIRKRAIAFLGMALLVAFSGFAVQAYAQDPAQDRAECRHNDGWFDQDIDYCEYQAP